MTDVEHNKIKIDEDIANSYVALKRAAKMAQERAKRFGHGVIIEKEGQIVEWFPDRDIYELVKPETFVPPSKTNAKGR